MGAMLRAESPKNCCEDATACAVVAAEFDAVGTSVFYKESLKYGIGVKKRALRKAHGSWQATCPCFVLLVLNVCFKCYPTPVFSRIEEGHCLNEYLSHGSSRLWSPYSEQWVRQEHCPCRRP